MEYVYHCNECGRYCLPFVYMDDTLRCSYDHSHTNITQTEITEDEYKIIKQISKNNDFFEAMLQLKENNIIEYETKMSQFRTQIEQQNTVKATTDVQTKSDIKCPHCGSTAITTGARGVNHFWGFLGASKTVNRCGKCGFTWDPQNPKYK